MAVSKNFTFDGGAGTYLGIQLGAFFITLFSIGIAYPWALCMTQKWKAKHTFINGRRLVFIGGGFSLIGLWLKWVVLMIITLGIYSFWVGPSLQKWIVTHTDFEDAKA